MHILYDCEQVKKVWIQFKNWWESHSHMRLNLCYKSIVFGYNIDHPDLLLNLCIILLKKMIFNCRFKHRVPTLAQFEDLVSFNYNLERKIAFANNTMHNFYLNGKFLNVLCKLNKKNQHKTKKTYELTIIRKTILSSIRIIKSKDYIYIYIFLLKKCNV